MAAELKEAPYELIRDEDLEKAKSAWHVLLNGIHALAEERGLAKKVFISYTWPPAGEERDALQAFLKRLQDDFQRAGIQTFLDLRNMQGNLDDTMRANLAASDFVMPILTPRFLARVQEAGAKPNNLQFEFNLMMEKAKANPACLLPILHAGGFGDVVLQEPLSPLAKHLIYTLAQTKQEPCLVGLSDPIGIIPVIYGIQFDDPAYQALLHTWLASGLTRLPKLPLHAIERRGLMAELFYQKTGEPVSVHVIQGIEGVGKTQLAMTYAHQHGKDKEFVYWIDADKMNLASEWSRLGISLGLDLKGLSTADQKQLIRQSLSKKEKWLIILDNLEDQATLAGLLPQALSPTQQVLITSRSKHWGDYPMLQVDPFTPEESDIYFTRHLRFELRAGSKKLAQALKHVPLALARAVHYMQTHSKTAKECLQAISPQLAAQHASSAEATPAVAGAIALAAEPAPTYIPNFFAAMPVAAAQPQAAAVDPKIAQQEAKLEQLEKEREELLGKTAYKGSSAVKDSKELAARIKALKEERDGYEDEDDFPKEKAACLKQCQKTVKALAELEKGIEATKKELKRLKSGSQASYVDIEHGEIDASNADIEAAGPVKVSHEYNVDAQPGQNVSVKTGNIKATGIKIKSGGSVSIGSSTNVGGPRL